MFALRLTGPLDSCDETYIPAPQEVKEAAYQGLVRPVLEYGSSVDPRCSSSGRIRKRAKVRSQIRDRKLKIWNWEYDWHFWTVKMGIPQEKEERQ